MPGESSPRIVDRLLEALSLAAQCQEQSPSDPNARAALHHALCDLIAELKPFDTESLPTRDTEYGPIDKAN